MKTGIIVVALLLSASLVNAQSLKDALYSGKLKTDTGTVIRKGEDLTSKIDTSTKKKPVEQEKIKTIAVVRDSTVTGSSSGLVEEKLVPVEAVDAPKDNNKIWKEYIDSLTATLRAEVLPSKKLKGGTYSVLIEYEIGLDGTIGVNTVSSSPESSFLEDQIKQRITLTAPQLTPLLNNYGKPRKAIKKQTITISK